MKRAFAAIAVIVCLFLFASAHPGMTDENGGHHDYANNDYHYHHGYEAHYHTNGVCPYSAPKETKKTEPKTEETKKPIEPIMQVKTGITESKYARKSLFSFLAFLKEYMQSYVILIAFVELIVYCGLSISFSESAFHVTWFLFWSHIIAGPFVMFFTCADGSLMKFISLYDIFCLGMSLLILSIRQSTSQQDEGVFSALSKIQLFPTLRGYRNAINTINVAFGEMEHHCPSYMWTTIREEILADLPKNEKRALEIIPKNQSYRWAFKTAYRKCLWHLMRDSYITQYGRLTPKGTEYMKVFLYLENVMVYRNMMESSELEKNHEKIQHLIQ